MPPLLWRCLASLLPAAAGLCLWWWLATPHPPTPPITAILPELLSDDPLMPRRGARNIIFIETTCAIKNESWSGLTSRQACALESAARLHPGPHWHIHVLLTCAPPPAGLRLPADVTAAHVTLAGLLRGSPLHERLVEGAALAGGRWAAQHAAHAMRLVALWKYGGLYLDLGLIVLRDMSELGEDWAVAESPSAVSVSALSLSARSESAGPAVAAACLRALGERFRGAAGHWRLSGPLLLTSVLAERCGATTTAGMADCGGFRVLEEGTFWARNHTQWQLYFSTEYADVTLAALRRAYAVRVWNRPARLSRKTAPYSAYARAAREACPEAYSRALQDV